MLSKRIASWRDDRGSIDFIQLVVGLLIVAIAAVGTLQALSFGYDHLKEEMRYRKAISIARAYLEYWQGRIHTDFDASDVVTRAGNLGTPKRVLIDSGEMNDDRDDVYGFLSYGPIEAIDQPETGTGIDYYVVKVYLKWWEIGQSSRNSPKEVKFIGTMVPAAL